MKTLSIQNYTGGSLLNARQLNLSMSLMLGADSRPKQLNRQQVMQLLNVIESLAMSSEVWFDGSIQDEDKAILKNHNNLYHSLLRETSLVVTDQWLNCCQEAVAQSSLLIKEWLESPSKWVQQKAVDKNDAELFKQCLLEGLALNFTERKRLAKETLERNDFRGSKCVAGLLVSIADVAAIDQPSVDDFNKAFSQAASQAEGEGKLISGLIDRFRVNFVN